MGGMLGDLSHAELMKLRAAAPSSEQGMLAPFEHRAFAREWAKEEPVKAGLSLPFAIPAYAAAKALGAQGARTPASLDQLFAGYHGYAEGMLDRVVPSAHAEGMGQPAAREVERDVDPRSFYEQNRDAHRARVAAQGHPNPALKHLLDIFLRGKRPSRDPSTWLDRTGAEDQQYEEDRRREQSLREHRTKAGFIGTRG